MYLHINIYSIYHSPFVCICLFKARTQFSHCALTTTEQLELIHTDIARPFVPETIEGRGKDNLVIVDDFNRKAWCIPLKRKSDTATAMKEWIAVHENEVGKKVKKMRSDNGGE